MSLKKYENNSAVRRARRVRARVKASGRLRLSVFRSARHIYAQIIEDTTGKTLVAASTVAPATVEGVKYTGNVEAAKAVGAAIAKKALEQNIQQVVFDRNGFLYHGRVKALADAAREAGLAF